MERSQITYPRWCGVEVESHTPESPQVAQQPRQGSKIHPQMDRVPGSIVDGCLRVHTGTLRTHACPCVSLSSSGLAAKCPEACPSAKVAWAARALTSRRGLGRGCQG